MWYASSAPPATRALGMPPNTMHGRAQAVSVFGLSMARGSKIVATATLAAPLTPTLKAPSTNARCVKGRHMHKAIRSSLRKTAGKPSPGVYVSASASTSPSEPAPSASRSRADTEQVELVAEALPPVPRSIHDVDNGKILGFGEELGAEHPGYHDEAYKRRRMNIVQLARSHCVGEPIPRVQYTTSEVEAWAHAVRELKALYPTHACKEFLHNWELFDFRDDVVPQLEDVSAVLKARTGWQIRPVAGLLHPRDFLNGLAFRTFHSTQYMRHHSQPMYTPEPDVIHELLGHVVMLTDPAYCDLVHAIGLASLGASEKEIWHLTKVYWYTVEFGVVKEGSDIKAFGAGILSSFGELHNMTDGGPIFEPLDPSRPLPKMSYKDGFQKRYFVMDSFEDGCNQLKAFSDAMRTRRPFITSR